MTPSPEVRARHRRTLARVEKRYRDAGDARAEAVQAALRDGVTYREIRSVMGVGLSTLWKLRDREPGTRPGKDAA